MVVIVNFDVRINNGDHFATFRSQTVLHGDRISKLGRIPCEVPDLSKYINKRKFNKVQQQIENN